MAVLYYVGRLLVEQLKTVDFSSIEISLSSVFGAAVFEILARFSVGLGYYMLLKRLHPGLSVTDSVCVSWVSNLGRYLPGKVALLASSAYFFKERGVKLSTAALVPVLNVLMTIVVALLLSFPLLFPNQVLGPYLGSAILMAGLFCLVALFRSREIRLPPFLHRWNLPQGSITLDRLNIGSCLGIVLIQCVCAGLSTWMICQTFEPTAAPGMIGWFISITAFAGVMGLIAFFSPAGLGVRDGLYLLLLGQIIGPETAALTTILLRLLQTLTDIILAAAGFILLKFKPSSSGHGNNDR